MHEAMTAGQALKAGHTPMELRSKSWIRVGHGLYRPVAASTVDDEREQRLRDLDPALGRGECFAHLTAAQVYGLWLPTIPTWLPVQVSLPPASDRPMRRRSRSRFR